MACATANVKFLLRRATATEWAAATSRILLDGEPGFDTTNNILKIGNGGRNWSQLKSVNFDLFGIPLAPTDLMKQQTEDSVSKTFSWTYPLQTQTGFSSNKLPLITEFHAQITYPGNTITLPTMPPGTQKLIVNMSSGGNNYDSGTKTYTYYNTIFQTITTIPTLTIWYSNYSTETPNKASVSFGSTFTLPHGAPSEVQNINVNPIRDHLIITYSAPAQNNLLVRGDSIRLDKYNITITSASISDSISINAPQTFYDYSTGSHLTGTYNVGIYASNTYSDVSVFTTTSVTVPISILNHNTTILETATSLSLLPYAYISGPAINDLIYYKGKFRTYTALDNYILRDLITESDGVKYTTFAFPLSRSFPSGLNIILRNVEGAISYVNQQTSSALIVGGSIPGIYYRFVTGNGNGPDYSTRWISANTTAPQDVSSSNYNNDSILMYNGLINTLHTDSEITFNVFAPNIADFTRNTTLFVTIKTQNGQNMSFSRIDYN